MIQIDYNSPVALKNFLDEKDMAIKYYFDTTFGNTIRVFKKSLMTSWLVDLEED